VLALDGSMGEGGGQILRTALALSLVLQRPFEITRLRAARRRPGLRRQHLACVLAAGEIGAARMEGARLGSQALSFAPSAVRHGPFRFDIGTAGSTTLVLQTVLPALLYADGPSEVTVTGGTHNPLAPPFEFLDRAYLPLLRRMGAAVQAELVHPGYVPRGGGEVRLRVEPKGRLIPLTLDARGEPRLRRATATVAGLPRHIAERELAVVASRLGWPPECLSVREQVPKLGPGNVLTLELGFDQVTEVFTGFGQRGVPAEAVAEGAVSEAREYLDADVAVGPHLADQLLLPLALGRGGGFTTVRPTPHTHSNWAVIRLFTGLSLEQAPMAAGAWRLRVQP